MMREELPRFVISDQNGKPMLACPVCGFTCVHIGSVNVEQGHLSASIVAEGVATAGSDRHKSHRGSEVSIRFWCEAGHAWVWSFSFHKGSTMVRMFSESHEQDEPELWRD